MAAYGPAAVPSSFSTDADFQGFVQAIHNALVGAGLTQTSDTGQVDSGTVMKPAGASSSQGYEVFRFSDALQATAPIFIKVEYGSGSSAAAPGIWVTVGSGTDGAGTVTGTIHTRRQIAWNGASAGTTSVWSSGDGSYVSFAFSTTTAGNTTSIFCVERTRDSTGANTGDACAVSTYGGFNGTSYACTPTGVAATSTASAHPLINPQSGAKSALGADVGVCTPVYFAGKAYWGLGYLGYNSADLGAGAAISTTALGATHTYMPIGQGAIAIAIRWE